MERINDSKFKAFEAVELSQLDLVKGGRENPYSCAKPLRSDIATRNPGDLKASDTAHEEWTGKSSTINGYWVRDTKKLILDPVV